MYSGAPPAGDTGGVAQFQLGAPQARITEDAHVAFDPYQFFADHADRVMRIDLDVGGVDGGRAVGVVDRGGIRGDAVALPIAQAQHAIGGKHALGHRVDVTAHAAIERELNIAAGVERARRAGDVTDDADRDKPRHVVGGKRLVGYRTVEHDIGILVHRYQHLARVGDGDTVDDDTAAALLHRGIAGGNAECLRHAGGRVAGAAHLKSGLHLLGANGLVVQPDDLVTTR